jgi:hypothetical protein
VIECRDGRDISAFTRVLDAAGHDGAIAGVKQLMTQ